MQEKSAFQTVGRVAEENLYVERKADKELLSNLLEGEFCYVLAPRRIGKSSLRFRTTKKLEEKGFLVANVDLESFIDEDMTAEQFYAGLIYEVVKSLSIDFDLEAFWEQRGELHWKHRWFIFLRKLVEMIDKKIVIFVDEIDQVRRLLFSCDDFFSSIRGIYEERGANPSMDRLTFCLMGVATPDELINDPKVTPFNIGKAVQLEDFTWEELKGFLPAMKNFYAQAEIVLREVFKWTNGHPSMSQRILAEIEKTQVGNGNLEEFITKFVERLFDGRDSDQTLMYAERRIDDNEYEKNSKQN